jgi:hypothetical protein
MSARYRLLFAMGGLLDAMGIPGPEEMGAAPSP